MCFIFNLIWRVSKEMPSEFRGKLLTLSFMMISICAYCYIIMPFSVHLLWKCIIGTFFMLLILIFSINSEIRPVKWNKKIACMWFLFGIFRFISGFTASLEFLPLACVWLFGFPSIFLVWNNRKDYSTLFYHLYKGCVYPTFAFFLLSLFFAPIGEKPYTGITMNANAVGLSVAFVFPLIFTMFLLEKHVTKAYVFNVICMWLSVAFAFLTRGRTVMLVILSVILVGVITVAFTMKRNLQYILKKILVLILGSIITVLVIIPVNEGVTSYLPNYSFEFSEYRDNINVNEAFSGFVTRMEGKDKAAAGMNNYSSGRIGIWQETISKLNVEGHPSRDHIVTKRNGDVGNNAHNVFIQFAYDNGIIAGLCFVVLVLISVVRIVRGGLNSTKNKSLYILILLISVSYICEGIVTSINLPFLYVISFVYYLIYAPLFDDEFNKFCKKYKES